MSDKVLLQDILEFTRDGEWGKENPFENSKQTRVIRGTDFEDVRIGKVDELPQRYVAERFVEYKELKPFDVLIETAGGSKNTPTGRTLFLKSSLFEKVDDPLVCASFARFLRFDDSKVVPEYLFWHLQYLYRNGVLKQYHVQHTGVARFQFTTFKESEYLELPDRKTQQKIASILSAFDNLIENNTRRIAILEEMAQRIYREWFVHFRFPSVQGRRRSTALATGRSGEQAIPADERPKLVDSGTDLGKIPEGWEVKKFGDLVEYIRDRVKDDDVEEKVSVLGLGDMPKKSITLSEWENTNDIGSTKLRFKKDDILFGKIRPYFHKSGFAQTPGVCSSDIFVWRPKERKDFVLALLVASSDKFVETATNSSSGTKMPRAKWDVLEKYLVAYPPDELLERLRSLVGSSLKQIRMLSFQNKKLKETRDLLLPKLISGKIEVNHLMESHYE